MSDPKLISPLLDNFTIGDAISEHNGVRCCPAIENDSNDKYIVKIISIPASNTQLDALLLSGAYSSTEAAAEYFKSLANSVVEEVTTLDKLSQLEGFFPITGQQVVPMDDGTGFNIYLLTPYRKTLAQLLRQDSMTHLSALNLALDICASLTICRRSGYLYVDLKPENIYMETGKSSKIGDLGFVSLDSLRFASLPERYRSAYTPPEISDAFASLNTTIDVYALGLILYQIYNDGLMPSLNDDANAGFVAPAYADYEMAEIILKCCEPNPEDRWKDPIELGQAIVAYMQRNGVHDTPITPTLPIESEISEETDTEMTDSSEYAEQAEDIPEEIDASSAEIPVDDSDVILEDAQEFEFTEYQDSVDPSDNEADDDLDFEAIDETSPEQQEETIEYTEISAEVSDILQQADDLISHQTPDPVVAPDPIDIPVPPPIQPQEDTESSGDITDSENEDESEQPDEDPLIEESTQDCDEEIDDEDEPSQPRGKIHWLRNVVVTLTVLIIAAIGVLFYTRYYLQPIDSITLKEHANGDLTVYISSPVQEDKLNVICSDTYGNQLVQPVVNGSAEFTGLSPDSAYTVKVAIDGFHKLTGDTSAAFTTPAQTNIVQFQAVTGSEDGSVILTFTIDGPDTPQWKVEYSSVDTALQELVFSGRMCTISGLTIGSEYKFLLTPVENINYVGTNELTYTASKIVKADNLRITGCLNGNLTAVWNAPEDTPVDSWTVRCYNDSGYDKTLTVKECAVTFDEVDNANAYTIEVTAAGMSVNERAFAPANSATVTDFTVDESNANKIVLTWNCNGFNPAGGWILLYTIDGSSAQEIRDITEAKVELSAKIPDAKYVFTLQAADGTSILGGESSVQTSKAKSFSGYGVSAKYMEFKMCERPSKKNWDRYDLSSSDYTSTFKVGEKASFLVKLKREYNTSKDSITTLYVIRDENGAIVSTSTTKSTWTKMWYRNYCELDIPSIPQNAGKYTISVYFNGALAHSQNFKVTA